MVWGCTCFLSFSLFEFSYNFFPLFFPHPSCLPLFFSNNKTTHEPDQNYSSFHPRKRTFRVLWFFLSFSSDDDDDVLLLLWWYWSIQYFVCVWVFVRKTKVMALNGGCCCQSNVVLDTHHTLMYHHRCLYIFLCQSLRDDDEDLSAASTNV